MERRRLIFAVGWAVAVASNEDGYRRVPGTGGALFHKSCIKEVPHGVVVDDTFDSECAYPVQYPNEQVYAMDTETDGNTTYVQLNSSWTTPKLPADDAQTVFFWPGFKATHPLPGYPVLQPVLQYGQRPGQTKWELQSWFVWAKHFLFPVAVTAPAITVSPGDQITSYMEFDATANIWTVYGKNLATGQESKLQVTRKKTGNQDFNYAMHVLETIMPAAGYCGDYPPDGAIDFTGISANHGQSVPWISKTGKTDCHQKIAISSDGSEVKFTWEAKNGEVIV